MALVDSHSFTKMTETVKLVKRFQETSWPGKKDKTIREKLMEMHLQLVVQATVF